MAPIVPVKNAGSDCSLVARTGLGVDLISGQDSQGRREIKMTAELSDWPRWSACDKGGGRGTSRRTITRVRLAGERRKGRVMRTSRNRDVL